ncbi:unnamed protein product [Debaryomyces fabryi]|nr:unnamed protein product [Debaryomyces fabryi]
MKNRSLYSNSTALYIVICLLGVLLPFFPFFKSKSVSSIEELQRIKSFIIDDLAVTIPIFVRFGDKGFNFPDLIEATQMELDYELYKTVNTNWRFKLIDELVSNRSYADDENYILELTHSDDNFVIVEPNMYKAQVHYSQASVHANDLPFFMTQATLEHLVSAEIELLRLLNSSEKPIDMPSIDAKIIIVGLESKRFEQIFEENFAPLKSLMTEALGLSNINITMTALESLNYENVTNSTDFAYYVYSDVHNKPFIPNKTIYPNCISYIHNDSLTNEDATHLISKISEELKNVLGLPRNPMNNLGIKLHAMKRYLTLKVLIESIDYLITAAMRNHGVYSNKIGNFINNLNPIIDSLHKNESIHDWNSLLAWSREFKNASSHLLEDSDISK